MNFIHCERQAQGKHDSNANIAWVNRISKVTACVSRLRGDDTMVGLVNNRDNVTPYGVLTILRISDFYHTATPLGLIAFPKSQHDNSW